MQALSFEELKNYIGPMRDHLLNLCNLYSEKRQPYEVAIHFNMRHIAYHALLNVDNSEIYPSIVTAATMDKTKGSMVYLNYEPNETNMPTVISQRQHQSLLDRIEIRQTLNLDLGSVSEKKEISENIVRIKEVYNTSYQEIANLIHIPQDPFESFVHEESFKEWLQTVYETHVDMPLKTAVKEVIDTEELNRLWVIMDKLDETSSSSAIELLTEYLVTHCVAKSNIIPIIERTLASISSYTADK